MAKAHTKVLDDMVARLEWGGRIADNEDSGLRVCEECGDSPIVPPDLGPTGKGAPGLAPVQADAHGGPKVLSRHLVGVRWHPELPHLIGVMYMNVYSDGDGRNTLERFGKGGAAAGDATTDGDDDDDEPSTQFGAPRTRQPVPCFRLWDVVKDHFREFTFVSAPRGVPLPLESDGRGGDVSGKPRRRFQVAVARVGWRVTNFEFLPGHGGVVACTFDRSDKVFLFTVPPPPQPGARGYFSGARLIELQALGSQVTALHASPTGAILAAGTARGDVTTWHVVADSGVKPAARRPAAVKPPPGRFSKTAAPPDPATVSPNDPPHCHVHSVLKAALGGGRVNAVHHFHAVDKHLPVGASLASAGPGVPGGEPVVTGALAVAGEHRAVRLFNLATGDVEQELLGDGDHVTTLAVVRLRGSADLLGIDDGAAGGAASVSLSEGGKARARRQRAIAEYVTLLVAGTHDGAMRIWNADTGSLRALATPAPGFKLTNISSDTPLQGPGERPAAALAVSSGNGTLRLYTVEAVAPKPDDVEAWETGEAGGGVRTAGPLVELKLDAELDFNGEAGSAGDGTASLAEGVFQQAPPPLKSDIPDDELDGIPDTQGALMAAVTSGQVLMWPRDNLPLDGFVMPPPSVPEPHYAESDSGDFSSGAATGSRGSRRGFVPLASGEEADVSEGADGVTEGEGLGGMSSGVDDDDGGGARGSRLRVLVDDDEGDDDGDEGGEGAGGGGGDSTRPGPSPPSPSRIPVHKRRAESPARSLRPAGMDLPGDDGDGDDGDGRGDGSDADRRAGFVEEPTPVPRAVAAPLPAQHPGSTIKASPPKGSAAGAPPLPPPMMSPPPLGVPTPAHEPRPVVYHARDLPPAAVSREFANPARVRAFDAASVAARQSAAQGPLGAPSMHSSLSVAAKLRDGGSGGGGGGAGEFDERAAREALLKRMQDRLKRSAEASRPFRTGVDGCAHPHAGDPACCDACAKRAEATAATAAGKRAAAAAAAVVKATVPGVDDIDVTPTEAEAHAADVPFHDRVYGDLPTLDAPFAPPLKRLPKQLSQRWVESMAVRPSLKDLSTDFAGRVPVLRALDAHSLARHSALRTHAVDRAAGTVPPAAAGSASSVSSPGEAVGHMAANAGSMLEAGLGAEYARGVLDGSIGIARHHAYIRAPPLR